MSLVEIYKDVKASGLRVVPTVAELPKSDKALKNYNTLLSLDYLACQRFCLKYLDLLLIYH